MVVWNRGSNVCAGDFGDFTGHVVQILMNGPETNLALLLQFGGNRTKDSNDCFVSARFRFD